ncbi:MAG: hypothetical protein KJ070_02650 [Verrucomicrobia bacterium]|nr:hypothetical protein [Verrucomicrobiota bacterium]
MQSRLLRATGVAASLLALFVMLGGHWLALQSVAWARMLAEFSRTDSFTQAVGKTFDGKHPCKLCLSIREGRQQEKREQREAPLIKTEKSRELYCNLRRIAVPPAPAPARETVAFIPRMFSDFVDSPPTPPPRSFAVL